QTAPASTGKAARSPVLREIRPIPGAGRARLQAQSRPAWISPVPTDGRRRAHARRTKTCSMEYNHILERFYGLLARCVLAVVALGGGLPAGAAVLHLDAQSTMHDTAGFLERLDDPGGRLRAAQADAADGWMPLPGSVNAGFTGDAVWLRLTVHVEQA